MKYERNVNICLSRFLSVYEITAFYNIISSNIGAKFYNVEDDLHNYRF